MSENMTGSDEISSTQPIRVLFVCFANICRSPMAEAVFRKKVADAGLSDKIETDSAGVSYSTVPVEAHDRVRNILKDHGIDCTHMSRRITSVDLNKFDYVLAMDTSVLRSIWGMGKGKARVQPVMKYATATDITEIPDPIRTDNFELVYDLVDKSTDGILAAIAKELSA